MGDDQQQALDPDLLGRYTLTTWGYKQGETVSLMIHLGTRLGLYEALDGAGKVTSGDLAAVTGLHERWLREWLRGQAAAQLLASEDGETFLLEPEAAAVLARSDGPTFAAGVFRNLRDPAMADRLAEAFRSGLGPTYDDQGEGSEMHVEAMLAPMARTLLVPVVMPMLEGVVDRLAAGAKVVDVGCGAGLALELLADAFPDSEFEGYDISERAIAVARERFADRANVTVHLAGGEDPAGNRGCRPHHDPRLPPRHAPSRPGPWRPSAGPSHPTGPGWSRRSAHRTNGTRTCATRCWP